MKRVFFAVASLAFAVAARAQEVNSPAFGILAGGTFPAGDYSKLGGPGWHAGAIVAWSNPLWPVSLRLDATYHRLGSKTISPGVDNQPTDLAGTLNAIWLFPAEPLASFRPYLSAGIGYNHLSNNFSCAGVGLYCTGDAGSDNKVGINGGIGAELRRTGVTYFVEARVHDIFSGYNDGTGTSKQSSIIMIPLSVGVIVR